MVRCKCKIVGNECQMTGGECQMSGNEPPLNGRQYLLSGNGYQLLGNVLQMGGLEYKAKMQQEFKYKVLRQRGTLSKNVIQNYKYLTAEK